jgi:hypothetical protein
MKMTSAQEEEARSSLIQDLKKQKIESFAMRRLFDVIPFIFADSRTCSEWKITIAQLLKVDPCSVFIIGSGCTGISLNPNKGYKAFDDNSDIDIAIISGFHFELGWRALRELGASKYNLDAAALASLNEHRDSHLYWGMIATDKILNILPFAKEWISAAIEIGKKPPMEGRVIKFRLYRDSYSFVSYHLKSRTFTLCF